MREEVLNELPLTSLECVCGGGVSTRRTISVMDRQERTPNLVAPASAPKKSFRSACSTPLESAKEISSRSGRNSQRSTVMFFAPPGRSDVAASSRRGDATFARFLSCDRKNVKLFER